MRHALKRGLIGMAAMLVALASPPHTGYTLTLGDPIHLQGEGRFGASLEMDWVSRQVPSTFGGTTIVKSQRYLLKPTLGIMDSVDLSLLVGLSKFQIDTFNGDFEASYGGAIRAHLFNVDYSGNSCCDFISFSAQAQVLSLWTKGHFFQMSDALIDDANVFPRVALASGNFNDNQTWNLQYRWNEYSFGLNASSTFGRVTPYIGATYTYIDGTKTTFVTQNQLFGAVDSITGVITDTTHINFRRDDLGGKQYFRDTAQRIRMTIGIDYNVPHSGVAISAEFQMGRLDRNEMQFMLGLSESSRHEDPDHDADGGKRSPGGVSW